MTIEKIICKNNRLAINYGDFPDEKRTTFALQKRGCLYAFFAKCFGLSVKITFTKLGQTYLVNKNSLKKWLASSGVAYEKTHLEACIEKAARSKAGVRSNIPLGHDISFRFGTSAHQSADLSDEQIKSLGLNLTEGQVQELDIKNLIKKDDAFREIFLRHPEGKQRVGWLNEQQVLQAYKNLGIYQKDFLHILGIDQLRKLIEKITDSFDTKSLKHSLGEKYKEMASTLTEEQVKRLDIELVTETGAFEAMFVNHSEGRRRVSWLSDQQVLQAFRGLEFLEEGFLALLSDDHIKNLSQNITSISQKLSIGKELARRNLQPNSTTLLPLQQHPLASDPLEGLGSRFIK